MDTIQVDLRVRLTKPLETVQMNFTPEDAARLGVSFEELKQILKEAVEEAANESKQYLMDFK